MGIEKSASCQMTAHITLPKMGESQFPGLPVKRIPPLLSGRSRDQKDEGPKVDDGG